MRRSHRRKGAGLLAVFLLGLSASGRGAASPVIGGRGADAGLSAFQGPADLRGQRPYHLLFLSFSPESARVLPRDRTRLSLQLTVANNFLLPDPKGGTVEEDTETQRLAANIRRGLGEGTEFSASLSLLARNGGFLDPVIEAYHRALGLSDRNVDAPFGRASVPNFRSVIRLVRPDGTTVVDAGPAFGPGDISAFLKRRLYSDPRTAVAARVGVKLPTGDAGQLLGSGGTDVGVDLDVSTALTPRIALFTNVGYIWMQKAPRLESVALTHAQQFDVALEYRAAPQASWLVQVDGSSLVVRTGNVHADSAPRTVTLAYRRRTGPHTLWTLALTENGDFLNYTQRWLANVGPDFTVSAGVEWQR